MKLSNRLENICNLIEECRVVADIGSDHGKVPAYLLKENVVKFAYVTDISKSSVTKAEILLKELKIDENRYKIIVSDGLDGFEDIKLDYVIISGMGGKEIVKILEKNLSKIDTFILEPNNNEIFLRKFLVKNKYKILCDFIVEDAKKFYNILKVVKGKQKLQKKYYYFGFTNFIFKNEAFKNYLFIEKTKCENVLNNNLSKEKQKWYKDYLKMIIKSLKIYKEQ